MVTLAPSKKILTFLASVVATIAMAASAPAEPMAAALVSDPVSAQTASLGGEPIAPPSLVPILALSVAAITMVRRRVRH